MRWGILANLAVILLVSGLLLFVVFSASLQRAAIDIKMQHAAVFADILENQILASRSSENMWKEVRTLCKGGSGVRLLLYGPAGDVLGGCGVDRDPEKPNLSAPGRRVRVLRQDWPSILFSGMHVAVDITGSFPHGVSAARVYFAIPPAVLAPAWKFFAGYLILTQAALFFLGYFLFHRTVIGPVSEAASLAGKASGLAEFPDYDESAPLRGDIQKISSSLRGMLVKIVEDRRKMEALIEQLRNANRDLEAAQQGLIRSEKLAGVGRLAAGLAHEIGNPLQIVMGYVELLNRNPEPVSATEILARMDQELRRIHDILQRLLDFASPTKMKIVDCDLNALVKDCESLIKGRKGFRNVEFEFTPEPGLPLIPTEPEKIRQVIVNLIFNAVDAVPATGGKISLRTRQAGSFLEIEVADNGSGIREADLEKVFDPFFTTKEPGKGTGLGLAVCLGLVESLGGSIEITSKEIEGTLAVVRLPAFSRAQVSI